MCSLRGKLRDAVARMKLDEVVAVLRPREVRGVSHGDPPIEVSDLAYDSRQVAGGSAFFCLPGALDDGHRHAAEAQQAGAAVLICEHPLPLEVPQVVVNSARGAMNQLAAPFFGYPSRRLKVVGVTGTNGKTTITYILDAIFRAAGLASGLIGTVETRMPGMSLRGSRTTPESVDLQRLLARMVGAGVGTCALEVTSIGLVQGRVEGLELAVAIFTNLTQDHLDFHGDLESYYQAKRSLFTEEHLPGGAVALVNGDDPAGARLATELAQPDTQAGVHCLTFGLGSEVDIRAVEVNVGPAGSQFRVLCPGLDATVQLGLPGRFNVSNALAALSAAMVLGVPAPAISAGLDALGQIPGRFEVVDAGQDFTVVVDYAHTPDGLSRVLGAARELVSCPAPAAAKLVVISASTSAPPQPRVIAVFGCGGDRDRGKRALMGAAAAAVADLVVVTSDNPRSEPPEAIIAEIEAGMQPSPPPLGYRLVPDRAQAIAEALGQARPGDVVVIAGKGHETTQSFADRVVDFDDVAVARAALEALQ